MHQQKLLSKILNENLFDLIEDLEEKVFTNCSKEFTYLLSVYKEFKCFPSVEDFVKKFTEFTHFETVNEDVNLLLKNIEEEKTYSKLLTILQVTNELNIDDSFKALDYIKKEIENIEINLKKPLTNIIKDGTIRLEESKKSKKDKFITTGFNELDEILQGWKKGEELVTLVGRTNAGKSWLMLKSLVGAWQSGLKVCLYSGEMSALDVGYRFDTLYKNFSNSQLKTGGYNKQYEQYINDLLNFENGFIVLTPQDFNNRNPTVSDIRKVIKNLNIDILGIDQLSLLESTNKSDKEVEKLGNISKELFNLSNEFKIPVLCVVQANRNALLNDETPKMEHIRGSDVIAHNSSKILTFRPAGAGFELAIEKNRDGAKDKKLSYIWDIDNGKMVFVNEKKSNISKDDLECY